MRIKTLKSISAILFMLIAIKLTIVGMIYGMEQVYPTATLLGIILSPILLFSFINSPDSDNE